MRPLYLVIPLIGILQVAAIGSSTAPTDSTPEYESFTPSQLLVEIESAEDYFRWYELRESVLRRNLDDPPISKALEDTEARLREEFPPRRIHENLELLGFRWKVHSMRTDGLARYRANWLFHLTEKTELEEGIALRLILEGRPKKDHAHLLLYELERQNGALQGPIRIEPSLSGWEPGSYHFFWLPFAAPLVPYEMSTYMIRKQGDRILGNWGNRIELGWYVDFPD